DVASTPASSDTTAVFAVRRDRNSGAISSSFCGLRPGTAGFGGGPASATDVTTRAPSTALPLGRMTVSPFNDTSALRHPSRIAPPMWPHPTNQVGWGSFGLSVMLLRAYR